MKFLFELFPVLLFFVAYVVTKDMFIATGVAMAATLAQVVWSWLRHRKVETMLWVNLGLITVLGGATLLLHDKTFIIWKPTALYWVFAVVLLAGRYGWQKNFIRKLLEKQVQLPEPVWDRLNLAWTLFFVVMGFINLAVFYQFGEAFWVNFKLFGATGLMFVFVIAQSIYLSRHIKDDAPAQDTP
jgi:intracellular septation protein